MKIAAILLNRNLPSVTDKLYHLIKNKNKDFIDVFIVDAGSDKKKNLQKYYVESKLEICKKKRIKIWKGYELWPSSIMERKKI